MAVLSFRTLSLLSSCLFLFGVVLAFIGYLPVGINVDSANADDRALAATLQIVAWTLVGVSVLPEIWIDVTGVYTTATNFHGRYGHRKSIILSWLQTLTFAGGVIAQGMAQKRPWDTDQDVDPFFRAKDYKMSWEALFMISSILLTISGALAIISAGCCCCGRAGREVGSSQKRTSRLLVQIASIMFLCGAIPLVFAISTDQFCGQCFLGYFLVITAYALWIACGILWIIADAVLPRCEVVPKEQEGGQQIDAGIGEVDNKPHDDLAVVY